MSDLTDRFAMSMYASRADRDEAMLAEIDRLTAENERLRTSWSTMARAGSETADLNGKLTAERDRLRERVAVLERLVMDAKHTLSQARIWNGMGWAYNPLHPVHYTQMRERLSNECDAIYVARAALKGER